MATINELMTQIRAKYDIVEEKDAGYTANNKIKNIDIWYRQDNVIQYRRIHLFIKNDGDAEFYAYNPLGTTTKTFTDKIYDKLEQILEIDNNIKTITIQDTNNRYKRGYATIQIYTDGKLTEKKILFWEENNDIKYQII